MVKRKQGINHDCILFAVLGMSPSVLTETIWALAGEDPPLVPNHVVVLTTSAGRAALEKQLFKGDEQSPCGWERLKQALVQRGIDLGERLKFGLAADHVRLFPSPSGTCDLADIATSCDNQAAADFMLRELRGFTENPTTQVLASIAGGRKTMGALLMSCMSLLGREQDRILHVLVNPPYDTPLDPPFFFPEQKLGHKTRDGTKLHSRDARIELIEVPFVRMRGWYEGAFKSVPPSYAALVAGVQRQAPPATVLPKIVLDRAKGRLSIDDGTPIRFSAPELAVLCLQLSGVWIQTDMALFLLKLKKKTLSDKSPTWIHDFQGADRFFDSKGAPVELQTAIEHVRRLLSSIRKKLASTVLSKASIAELLPRREAESSYRKIRITGADPFADIRG